MTVLSNIDVDQHGHQIAQFCMTTMVNFGHGILVLSDVGDHHNIGMENHQHP